MKESRWRTWYDDEIKHGLRGDISLVVREIENGNFSIDPVDKILSTFMAEAIARGFDVTTYVGVSKKVASGAEKLVRNKWKCKTYASAVKRMDDYLIKKSGEYKHSNYATKTK
jgi:hypothetical protein